MPLTSTADSSTAHLNQLDLAARNYRHRLREILLIIGKEIKKIETEFTNNKSKFGRYKQWFQSLANALGIPIAHINDNSYKSNLIWSALIGKVCEITEVYAGKKSSIMTTFNKRDFWVPLEYANRRDSLATIKDALKKLKELATSPEYNPQGIALLAMNLARDEKTPLLESQFATISEQQEQLIRLKQQQADVLQQLETKNQSEKQLKQALHQLQENQNSLLKQLEELREKQTIATQLLSKHENTLKEEELNIAHEKKQAESYRAKYLTLMDKKNKLQIELDQLNVNVNVLQEQQTSNENVLAEALTVKAQYNLLTQQSNTKQNQNEDLRRKLTTEKENVTKLQLKLQQLETHQDLLQQDGVLHQGNVEQLKEQISSLQAQIKTQQELFQQTQGDYITIGKNYNAAQERIALLMSQQESSRSNYEQKLAAAIKIKDLLKNQTLEVQATLDQTICNTDQLTNENEKLLGKLTQLQNTMQEHINQENSAKSELASLKTTADRDKSQAKDLLAEKQTVIASLQEQIATLEGELQIAARKTLEFTNEIQTLQASKADNNVIQDGIREELQRTKGLLEEKEGKIQKLERSLEEFHSREMVTSTSSVVGALPSVYAPSMGSRITIRTQMTERRRHERLRQRIENPLNTLAGNARDSMVAFSSVIRRIIQQHKLDSFDMPHKDTLLLMLACALVMRFQPVQVVIKSTFLKDFFKQKNIPDLTSGITHSLNEALPTLPKKKVVHMHMIDWGLSENKERMQLLFQGTGEHLPPPNDPERLWKIINEFINCVHLKVQAASKTNADPAPVSPVKKPAK